MNATRTAIRNLGVALAAAAVLAIAPLTYAGDFYGKTNLVSDQSGVATHTDSNLVNAWGIVMTQTSPVWVNAADSGFSIVYDGLGNPVGAPPIVVAIPAPPPATQGSPTGIVANPTSTGFVITKGTASGSSRFIFATEEGVIAGWNPGVDATNAVIGVNNSANGAIYKGLAISANGTSVMLYATDFHNARVDVFNASFGVAAGLPAGAFTDPAIPHGFAPFGIQAIGGNIYVTYAKQDAAGEDDVAGKGLGYVNVFDPNGVLLGRVASKGKLNAPWGIALAPAGFGKFAGNLLIGNFGDGTINAYDAATGKSEGQLKGADHHPLKIDGLWGLAFGNGFNNAPVNTLFFTAGPDEESHGLYGRLDVIPGDDHDHDPDAED
jgi:uncharacterized protein (TIGR03118 family)